MPAVAAAWIERVFREFGDIDIAGEAVQDAENALDDRRGDPDLPGGRSGAR